jgi:ABC-2 type transport system permease protein
MSVRARDVRVAQQLATLASLPALGITTLITFRVITPSVQLAVALAAALLVVDLRAWRFVSKLFDRERLITGTRARPS